MNLIAQVYKVMGKEKWSTTRVNGTGGGGYIYNGIGYAHPVNITSTTILHDRLYLQDSQGNLHDIELQNWNIGCLEGHALSMVWDEKTDPDTKERPLLGIWISVKELKEMGSILAIKNQNTGKVIYNDSYIKRLSRNHWALVIPIVAVIVYLIISKWMIKDAGMGWLFPGLLIGVLVWQRTWNPRTYRELKTKIGQLLR